MTIFFLLSSQRTGSAFLEQCLNSHINVLCQGEILLGYGEFYHGFPPAILRRYRRLRTLWQAVSSGAILNPKKTMESCWGSKSSEECKAFRLMHNQIQRDYRVKRYLKDLLNVKIIHLRRRNLIKQYVSLELMHNQSKYGRFSAHVTTQPELVKINIDSSKALAYINKIYDQRKESLTLMEHLDYIELDYEDIIRGGALSEEAVSTLADFLDVQDDRMVSSQVKMNSSNLREVIANFSELELFFESSPYSEWLYES